MATKSKSECTTSLQTLKMKTKNAYTKLQSHNRTFKTQVTDWLISQGFECEGNYVFKLLVDNVDVLYLSIEVTAYMVNIIYHNERNYELVYREYSDINGLYSDISDIVEEAIKADLTISSKD